MCDGKAKLAGKLELETRSKKPGTKNIISEVELNSRHNLLGRQLQNCELNATLLPIQV